MTPQPEPRELDYDPEKHDPPPMLSVHEAALHEISVIVGNQETLGEEDTAQVRGIIFAARSKAPAREVP